MAQETGNGTTPNPRRELRLAIVCYGGEAATLASAGDRVAAT